MLCQLILSFPPHNIDLNVHDTKYKHVALTSYFANPTKNYTIIGECQSLKCCQVSSNL